VVRPWALLDTKHGWVVEEIERETALCLFTTKGRRYSLAQLVARFTTRRVADEFRSRALGSAGQMQHAMQQAREQHAFRMNRIRFAAQTAEVEEGIAARNAEPIGPSQDPATENS